MAKYVRYQYCCVCFGKNIKNIPKWNYGFNSGKFIFLLHFYTTEIQLNIRMVCLLIFKLSFEISLQDFRPSFGFCFSASMQTHKIKEGLFSIEASNTFKVI